MIKKSCANCVRGPLFEDSFLNDRLCVALLETKEHEYTMCGQRFTISTEWDCARFRSPVSETLEKVSGSAAPATSCIVRPSR